ncbi:glycosyltransferase involved in cell wall biosynthesis [Sphingomonas faeni]|nr:glycosyltransferase involved in cell wall biosynthesis [Sphingomonas faeni]
MHEAHGPVEAYSKSGNFVFRQLARFSRFRRLVTINGALAQYYITMFPRLLPLLYVAPSGTDPVKQPIHPVQPVPGQQLRVGYVGSMFPGKGMELIAELAMRTDYTFVVAGGDAESIAYWKQKVEGRVEFLGHLPNRDVDALINTFDVALAPYLENVGGLSVTFNLARWMSPLKLFEYMAHARAILVSDLPAIREVVQNDKEVLLCNPRDIEDWILALDRLAQDPGLREKLGRNALSTFLNRFTWDQRAAGILEAIAA